VITVRTLGHGARPLEEFLALVTGAGVELVDVRTAPGSRRHPHFGKEPLAGALRERGVVYDWRRELGGWRKPRPDSRHTALRNQGFRGYADHMETEEFQGSLGWLMEAAAERPTAVMCSESLWWRCHRSLIADALTVAGCEVLHVLPDGSEQRHEPRPAARIEERGLVYDRA
jgi:uncharacterized protein (DUF488 family)